ncbi:MAG TPA: hypothetical protein VGT03_12710 [Candidatus Acidoferrales bacterium]|nr:hypothetical protein [Candidatus Acidoferrales bacterium]
MSLIWEQLKSSENFVRQAASEGTPAVSEEPRLLPIPMADRRKSGRSDIYVPLFVYGYTLGRVPFHEDTNSVEVCVNGGLLRLEAPVRCGQKLLLQNKVSNQELECTVVRVAKQLKRTFVGVAFERSVPGFWKCRKQLD